MNKLLSLVLSLSLLITLFAGCAGIADPVGAPAAETAPEQAAPAAAPSAAPAPAAATEPATADSGDAAAEEFTIRMAWWGSQIRHDATLAAIDYFMEQNPGVKVESEFTGFDGYWDKVATQAAAGSLPNVWQQSFNYVKQYADAGQILDLQPFVDSGIISLDDWSEAAIGLGRLSDGKLYSLTMGNVAHTICFDPELLTNAGIPLPHNDWTWDEYFDIMRQVRDKLGIFGDGTYPDMNETGGLKHFVFSQGHTFYSADQKSLGFPQELMVEWLTREYAAQEEGLIPDPAVKAEITTPEQSLLVTGEAAMVGSNNSNMTVGLMAAAGKKFSLVTYPHEPGEVRYGTVLGPSMLINLSNIGTDAEKDMSAKLLNFLLNDPEANRLMLGERGVPGSLAASEAILPLLSEENRITFEYINEISPKLESDPEVIGPPATPEVVALYKRIHDQVLFGDMSVEEGTASFFDEANALLSRE